MREFLGGEIWVAGIGFEQEVGEEGELWVMGFEMGSLCCLCYLLFKEFGCSDC